MFVSKLESIKIRLASPEDIMSWSHGEVTKPETINYRTQKPEKDGLFCEKIFGPEKDYKCACGKYRGIRYKGVVCDKCGVEITISAVRRERMGHIKLASPVSHIWFLRGVPSIMGMILEIPAHHLEKIIYFASYIIKSVNNEEKTRILKEIEKEYEAKKKERSKSEAGDLKKARDKAKEEVLSLKTLKVITEAEYLSLSFKYGEAFEAGTGGETLRKIFEKIDLKEIISNIEKKLTREKADKKKLLMRRKVAKEMLKNNIRPEWMFLTVLPVLPPDLRPMVQLEGGRFASSDLNDLYRRVINRNTRLKYLLEIDAPEVIVRNEKRMLQEAVDALIDNGMRKGQTTTATTGGKRLLKSLADMLKGKKGRFRQNLLGKRVDYSGRSVIASGPNLRFNECGLPKIMALELFKPFVIAKLLQKELVFNVRGASRMIEEKSEEVWKALEEITKDKYVLLNRAPTLHRLGIQAFKIRLIEDSAIRLYPLACEAFNADFDGDQMAVHLPLSDEAQKEAKEIMLSGLNLLKPAAGSPIVALRQEMVLGCYWITTIVDKAKGEGKIFGSRNEAILASDTEIIDIRARVGIRMRNGEIIKTSVGRVIFNNTLPKSYPFQDIVMDKGNIKRLMSDIIDNYENKVSTGTIDGMKDLGFEYAARSGVTWGMDDLVIPPQKKELVEKAENIIDKIEEYYEKGAISSDEKFKQAIGVWQKTKSDIEKLIPGSLPRLGSMTTIVESGARGSWAQPLQMAGMKGLVINPSGKTIELPIKSSYKEGFSVLEYFLSTHGARKGTADTALRTSAAGYLTRRLIDVAHSMIITEEDCKDTEGITLDRLKSDQAGQNFLFQLTGRISLDEVKGIIKKGEMIDWKKAREIVDAGIKTIKVRSPLSCKTKVGLCQKCYGANMGNNKLVKLGEAVGIVAAQAIGEPGTQLTLRTFHAGGVADAGDITQGLPRVEEIFENRPPKGKALIAEHEGKIIDIKDGLIKIRVKKKEEDVVSDVVEYDIPLKKTLWVKKGEEVKKGQQLCEGSIDLKELFKISGFETTYRYILSEVQEIYSSQGVNIHNKHIEVIIKLMFSRVQVDNPGDSLFNIEEVAEEKEIIEENKKLKKQNKKLITYHFLLLGVSRVALSTKSFLSAASFQQTSKVLIFAAIEGKEDKLVGLKENVIIGKLIPAGTGFVKRKKDKK